MKKRILACLLALVMLVGLLPATVLAEDVAGPKVYVDAKNGNDSTGNGTEKSPYKTVGKALENIGDNATVYLADGNYSTYAEEDKSGQAKYCAGKTVTFVGTGAKSVNWQIGAEVPNPALEGTEYNGDYSFDGAKSVTFKNLTLMSAEKDYLGFIRTDNTVVENCTVKGKTFYWGYTSAKFVNTTFICPPGDYAIWTYSSPIMTFDNCIFESSGKVVNVYTDYSAGKHDITVNFKDCTVHSTNPESKSFLNINDANMGKYKYILNFTGINTVDGIKADGIKATEGSHKDYDKEQEDVTCSKLFEFNTKRERGNSGRTVVNIDGKTVWEKGKMVSHSVDTTNDKYTDGYKDNAFTVTETGWVQQPDGSYKWMVTRVCQYCGYTETVEDEVDDITAVLLPALQANTDDHYSYLIGYADGTVRPNGKITRAEVATIFFRLLDDDTRAKYWSSKNDFSDVSADKWYNNAVSTLSNMGVIGGYADGTFRPDAPISRAEFAKIAVSFTQNNGSATYNYFTDVKTTDWFAPYVTAAKDAGLIEGYSDGSFKPESKITRAEACAIVNRTLGRKPSKAHMKISDRIDWPDVQTTDWFYEAIMEATNSHTCTMGDRVETWTGKLPQRDWATLETGWANAYTGR